MTFTIAPEWNAVEQRQHSRTFIESKLVYTDIEGGTSPFLPFSAITELATKTNIKRVVDKDLRFARLEHFPPHSRVSFANTVHKSCQRQFAICMYMGASMLLLREIWNQDRSDDDLPVPEDLKLLPELEDEYKWVKIEQYKFCVEVLEVGGFDQELKLMCMTPWTKSQPTDSLGMRRVTFHPDHLIKYVDDLPVSYTERTEFYYMAFDSKAEAEDHQSRKTGKFGFECRGKYHLLFT